MEKKGIISGFFAAFIWGALFGPACGQQIPKIEIRTIGIPPYGIESDEGAGGIYYDMANLLAKEAGYQVNNNIYPYARIVNELKSGQTDMTIMFKYRELEEHVIYVAPLPSLRTVVIGPAGSSFNSIESLKGKRIAYLRGAKFSDIIDKDPTITKQITNDFTQGIKMLMFGRVDAIIGPLDPILRAAKGKTLGKPLVVDERTPWVQISKKSAPRLSADKLNSVFLDIVNRGALEKIRRKYGSEND